MKKGLRRIFAVVLMTAMLASVLTVHSAAAEGTDAQDITVKGTLKEGDNEFVMDKKDESLGEYYGSYYGAYYRFVPEADDYYCFSQVNGADNAVMIYDSDMQEVTDTKWGSYFNLKAGQEYYVYSKRKSETEISIIVSVRRGLSSGTLTAGEESTIYVRGGEPQFYTFTAEETGIYEFYSNIGRPDQRTIMTKMEASIFGATLSREDGTMADYSFVSHDGNKIFFNMYAPMKAGEIIWLMLRNYAEVDQAVYAVNIGKLDVKGTLSVGDNKIETDPGRSFCYKFVPEESAPYSFYCLSGPIVHLVYDPDYNYNPPDKNAFYQLEAGKEYYVVSTAYRGETERTIVVRQDYGELALGATEVTVRRGEYLYYEFVPGQTGAWRVHTEGACEPKVCITDVEEDRTVKNTRDIEGHADFTCDLTAGKKYIVRLSAAGEGSGDFTFHIDREFADVPQTASYYNSVCWGTANGIISGTTASTFSPDDSCTRYQLAVMMYKLAGKPAVEGPDLPFTDVEKSASYYNAVKWAYNQNIISGTTKTTFAPNAAITRYQVVKMLYKMAGRPQISNVKNPFKDVSRSDSYYDAVMWAYQNKITVGTTKTTFSPNQECKRYQMVVFLNKYNQIYQFK